MPGRLNGRGYDWQKRRGLSAKKLQNVANRDFVR
jgi:hypothetical protein